MAAITTCFRITMSALALVLMSTPLFAQSRQTQADAFTRYELLAPETESFRITYYVSAATEGATRFYNQIRPGSEPDVHGVYDRMTGDALEWSLVKGDDALASGLIPNADETSEYIRVDLARAVPANGRGRLLIDKTYKDAESYFSEGNEITFTRTLGVKRNAVVLPDGYELVSVNYPSQVILRDDGRLELSFINPGVAGVPYEVKAKPIKGKARTPKTIDTPSSDGALTTSRPVARIDADIPQRASQTRDIVYFLQDPATHSFRLYHDYEETREGMDRYLNVVRPGSRASNPSAKILDTGEALTVETLRGAEITDRDIDIGEAVTGETELVVIWFDPVEKNQTRLLRIEETYTDSSRYFPVSDQEFLWDRSFGRSRNKVVLPEGWRLIENAVPATVATETDGRVSLTFVNDRPGVIDVLIRGRRRP
ncbi:MAG: hypothetical protein AAFX54_08800 [Pseudomonadota bacterium]